MAAAMKPNADRTGLPSTWATFERLAHQLASDPFLPFASDPFELMRPEATASEAGDWPRFEIKATDEAYSFRGDLPGVAVGDVEVTVEGGMLRVRGARAEDTAEPGDTWYARERQYGTFVRQWTLPADARAGDITAELTDGVLTITAPRSGAQVKRKIHIGELAHRVREKLQHAIGRK